MEKSLILTFGERTLAFCKRFPLALTFIVILTAFILALIHTDWDLERETIFFGLLYLPTAAIMALSFHLLNEEVRHKLRGDAVEAIVLIGWLAYCGYLTDSLTLVKTPMIYLTVVCILCIIISVFTLSFYHQESDIPFWRFSMKLFISAFIAWGIGGILTGGILLLFESFRQLFNWALPEEAYASAATICIVFVAPILFLIRIPRKETKQNATIPNLSKFYKGVIYNLFVPMLMCYLLTLYLYAIVILVRWELPNGWVSWLTSFLMLGMLTLVYMIYPQQFFSTRNRVERFIVKWLPLMILPILLLMSIGIYRRITDYGISIDRLYILLFNVWCYVVCLTLFFLKSKRIWWIPVSFCILFFLASVGPWSCASITKRKLLHEVEEALKASGKSLPMDTETYRAWVESLPEDKKQVEDKMDYLNVNYGSAVRRHLVDDISWSDNNELNN